MKQAARGGLFCAAAAAGAAAILPLLGVLPAVAQTPLNAEAQAPPLPAMPEAEAIVILVRTALLTLNDAVQSGNFTVLRDLAAPGFRDAHTAAKLSQIFASLIRDRIDLSSVAAASPQLTEAPTIDAKTGLLTIRGSFAAGSSRLTFALAFQSIEGRWRMFGISAQPVAVFGAPPAAARAFSDKAEKPPAAEPQPPEKKAPR